MKVFVKQFVDLLSLKEIISGLRLWTEQTAPNAIIVFIMFGSWIWKISRTSLKRFTVRDYTQKIRHCDLLHRFMFHHKKSCRKTTFLSCTLGEVINVCIAFGSWIK